MSSSGVHVVFRLASFSWGRTVVRCAARQDSTGLPNLLGALLMYDQRFQGNFCNIVLSILGWARLHQRYALNST